MDDSRLRAIIIKLQDRLSNDDRKRLHFYLGNDVPRRIRDDPSLGGTLSLMDSLFDQDKINARDFSFLINAFDEIQCLDAVKLLKEHWRHNQSHGLNQSIDSLAIIMPSMIDQLLDEEENRYATQSVFTGQQNTTGANTIIDHGDTRRIDADMKSAQLWYSVRKLRMCLWILVALSVVGYGLIIYLSHKNSIDMSNQFIPLVRGLEDRVKQLDRRVACYLSNGTNKTTPPYPSRWSGTAETVAQELNRPRGLFVNEEQTVYIADYASHSTVAWEVGATTREVLAGGKGVGERLDQLNGPTDVLVDRETDTLLICDRDNRRVMRWPRHPPPASGSTQGEIVIDNIPCRGITLDIHGALYVSDTDKHVVRRYDEGGSKDKEGTVVAGSRGKGASLDQFNWPTFLFVDWELSLYVSDNNNHRVMKWIKGATAGVVVAGGQGEGDGLSQLSSPRGVWVDGCGHVYVADELNHRVVRWQEGAKEGTVIVGGNGKGAAANQLSSPHGLFFDRHGHLYITDCLNNRVQRFSLLL